MLWVISTSTLRSWSPGASAIIKAVWIWMNSLRKCTSPGIRFSTCTTWWSPTSRVWAACWCYLTDKEVDWGLIENFRLVCLILDSWDVHTHHHEDSREGAMPIISGRSLTVNAEGAIFATVLGRGKLHDHTTRSAEFYPAHECFQQYSNCKSDLPFIILFTASFLACYVHWDKTHSTPSPFLSN